MPAGAGIGDVGGMLDASGASVRTVALVESALKSELEEVEAAAPDAAAAAEGVSAEAMSPPLAFEEAPWNHAATNGTLATTSAVFQFKKELAFIIPNRFPPPMRPLLMSPGWRCSLPSKWPAHA